MTGKEKKVTWIIEAALTIVGVTVVLLIHSRNSPLTPILLTGAIVREDTDEDKQTPLPNTTVTATGGFSPGTAVSDASGLFKLSVQPALIPGRAITMRFEHPGYKPVEITRNGSDMLYVVRMKPEVDEPVLVVDHGPARPKTTLINNVRVR